MVATGRITTCPLTKESDPTLKLTVTKDLTSRAGVNEIVGCGWKWNCHGGRIIQDCLSESPGPSCYPTINSGSSDHSLGTTTGLALIADALVPNAQCSSARDLGLGRVSILLVSCPPKSLQFLEAAAPTGSQSV